MLVTTFYYEFVIYFIRESRSSWFEQRQIFIILSVIGSRGVQSGTSCLTVFHRCFTCFLGPPKRSYRVTRAEAKLRELADVSCNRPWNFPGKLCFPASLLIARNGKMCFILFPCFILEFLNPERTNTYSSRGGLQDFSQMPGLGHCCNMLQSL